MKRKKILIISVGLWPPAVEMSGMKAVYQISKLLAEKGSLEIHLLSNLSAWSQGDIDRWIVGQRKKHNLSFHFVERDRLFLIWLLFFAKVLALHGRQRFDLIHVYSASPLLVAWTGVLGKLCGCKTVHTLCSVNEDFWGSEKLAFGFSWVDNVIDTTPFGVDIEEFRPVAREFQKKILFLGSLDERKGAPVLMRAAEKIINRHPEAQFIFASYGEEVRDPNYLVNRQRLEGLGANLGKNVKFLTGMRDVPQLMSSVDIFVLPPVSLHGTLTPPLTLIEAMSAGKPCAVSDVCRGDGLVEDGVNCLLFQSGNAGDLGDKINLLLSDEILREKLSRNARQEVVEQFDVNKITEELAGLYGRWI